MSIAFKAATVAANTILANDKKANAGKLEWKAMPFSSMPDDIRAGLPVPSHVTAPLS